MVEEKSGKDIKKILVVILAGLGDLVMSSAAVRSLKNKFPDCEMDFLVFAQNRELAQNCPYIREVFVLNRQPSFKGLAENMGTFLRLRKRRFDLAVNLYNIFSSLGGLRMFFLFVIIKARQSLGRNTDGKGFFYNLKINDSMYFKKHQVEYMLDVVGVLGSDISDKRLEVWYDKSKEGRIREFLRSQGISENDIIIGINPGGSRPSRRWPVEKFAALIKLILQRYPAKIVITGTRGELPLAEKTKGQAGSNVVISSGMLGLSELIILISRCKVYITNDTGPMHIANVLGVPVIALVGGGPEATFPFIKEKITLVKSEVACSPCYSHTCNKGVLCLNAVEPAMAMEALDKIIGPVFS